jgi:predicted metal-dependent hydrolase
MSAPVVRRLLIDLETPFARHWFGGDAFRTAFANALSMSFPLGEQFFIDSVRAGVAALPEAARTRFAGELQGFSGQEATHRRIHALFNAQLEKQGHANIWEGRIRERMTRMEGLDARHAVAATAANEHFTAVLADWLLRRGEWFGNTEPRLTTLWLWHASEEMEHRSTAFDVYLALGGDLRRRRRWMRLVTWYFLSDLALQTWRNLKHDRVQWHWSTWRSALVFLLGRAGVVRCSFKAWLTYFRRDFHPSQSDGSPGSDWLAGHREAYTPLA